jgi:hypothetical protein
MSEADIMREALGGKASGGASNEVPTATRQRYDKLKMNCD